MKMLFIGEISFDHTAPFILIIVLELLMLCLQIVYKLEARFLNFLKIS